jgi:dCMP deaminase
MSDITKKHLTNKEILDNFLLENVINKADRLSWDNYLISLAVLATKRSSCDRLQVGCIIVKNKRVISTGYNGFLEGSPHVSRVVNNHEQFTIHAEQNAICYAAKEGVSLRDSVVYITHYPCINCFKLLIAAGVTEVKYLEDYKNDPLVVEMAIENSIRLIKINN